MPYSRAQLLAAFRSVNGRDPSDDELGRLEREAASRMRDDYAQTAEFAPLGERVRQASLATAQPGMPPPMGFSDIPGQRAFVNPPGFDARGGLARGPLDVVNPPDMLEPPRPTPTRLMESTPTTVAVSGGSRVGRAYDHRAGLSQVYRDALSVGLGEEGARAAVAIAQTEGGMGGAEGDMDQGGSAGTFQLFFGGGQGNNFATAMGLGEAQAKALLRENPHVANAWALTGYLGQAIKTGLAQGLTGPALATFAQKTGQVSVTPERAGQNYATLFAGGSRERQQFLEQNTPGESTTITPARQDARGTPSIPDVLSPQAPTSASTNPTQTTTGEDSSSTVPPWLRAMQAQDAYSRHIAQQLEAVPGLQSSPFALPNLTLPGFRPTRPSRFSLPMGLA